MRRKFVIIAVSVVAAALIAAATLPLWLGAALGAAGGRFGVTFDEYRRVGYSRFALEGLRVKTDGVEVKVSRVELNTPLEWLGGRRGHVAVEDWSVEVADSDAPPTVKPRGWVILRAQLDRILAPIERWLPSASARSGRVAWEGGHIDFGATTWKDGEATVESLSWREVTARVVAKHDATDNRLTVRAENSGQRWVIKGVSAGDSLEFDGTWFDQPWVATAAFDPTGWLPREARADAVAWSLPGVRLGLGEFYEKVNARGSVAWRDRALAVDVKAAGEPVEGAEVPPLQVELHGSGAMDRLSVDRLEITLPGVTGTLSEPLVLASGGKLVTGASRFDLAADLAQLPWAQGSGRVTGSINVTPGVDGVPVLDGVLTTAQAVVAGQAIKTADVAVRVEWPDVRVNSAHIELADGDRLTLGGHWQAKTRTLTEGKLNAHVSRATAARWLPEKAQFETITVEAQAEGVWPGIVHRGRLTAQALQLAPLRALSGTATWRGEGAVVPEFTVEATAGATQVRAGGAVDAQSARVDTLVLTQDGEERLRLATPARVVWAPALKIDPLEFTGPDSRLAGSVDWVERGSVAVEAKNLRSTLLRDLVELPGPDWTLSTLAVQGAWTEGPLVFTAKGAASVVLADGRKAELALSAGGDGKGVELETLSASMQGRPVATVSGRAPLTLWPWSERRVRLDDDGPLALDAVTSPHAAFWEQLAELTGLVITEPDVNVRLAGTVKKPAGEGRVRIAKISPGAAEWARSLPRIEGVEARLTGDRGGLVLESFSASVSGQAVRASGRLPIKDWAAVIDDPLALARVDGEARIQIPDAEVAALASYVPTALSPAGTLQVDVSLKPGGQLYGSIRLKDAATRPLGPLGILQSIGADLELDGRTVIVKDVHAVSGGQPVVLTGTATLSEDGVAKLDLALKGENLPFVRQAGLLVRGDIDLRIKTGEDEVTRITGGTRLRDSLFLMDVRALLPTGGGPRGAPGRRPPYFAVELPPFNAWALDVTVRGDRFLRLRTPVFTGVASANFRLGGTLGDPRLTGEATVNQGQVLLPFATFTVQQGWVRLTAANPFEPRVSLTGTSRRYGYDLRMDITGSVEKPELTFSSTPALESEQVLLMVMAGETPQNEVSYTGRERAARLGAYLGQSLLGQLGLDSSAQDRLSVNIGERISRQGRETYEIEYELAPRWSVVGEYDEFDEYNVGVKWKIFSQKRPESVDNTKEAEHAK
jgi:translocation and assembly module TamB